MFKSKPESSGRFRWVVLIGFALWVLGPISVWLFWGLDQAETYLTQNALPVGLLFNLLVLAVLYQFGKNQTARGFVFLLIAAILWLVANPMISGYLTDRIEGQFESRSPEEFEKPFRAVLMLGGCTAELPGGQVEVNHEGQRLVATASLWHAKKTDWIIVTGLTQESEIRKDHSRIAKRLLVGLGVPENKILKIAGRSTSHEMASMADFLNSPPDVFENSQGEMALVTSAFHMPRAMKLAAENGLSFTPIPTGRHARSRSWLPSDLLPSAQSLSGNSTFVREWLARLVGR